MINKPGWTLRCHVNLVLFYELHIDSVLHLAVSNTAGGRESRPGVHGEKRDKEEGWVWGCALKQASTALDGLSSF